MNIEIADLLRDRYLPMYGTMLVILAVTLVLDGS